jgi:hypothetical protein
VRLAGDKRAVCQRVHQSVARWIHQQLEVAEKIYSNNRKLNGGEKEGPRKLLAAEG